MPGRGSIERKALAFRNKKNEQFELTRLSNLYSMVLGVDLKADSIEELETLRTRLFAEALEGKAPSVSVVVAEAYATDPPLLTAIEHELIEEFEQCSEIAPFELSCLERTCESQVSDDVVASSCITDCHIYTSVVVKPEVFKSITHLDHPSLSQEICGSVIRGCDHPNPDSICRDCAKSESEHDFVQDYSAQAEDRADNIIVQNICEVDKRYPLRTRTKCRCLDMCSYSIDMRAEISRIRGLIRFIDHELVSTLQTYHPVVRELVEQQLTCREKFLLMLHDNIPRAGCRLRRNMLLSSRKTWDENPGSRCICSTILFQDPSILKRNREAIKVMGFQGAIGLGPPDMQEVTMRQQF